MEHLLKRFLSKEPSKEWMLNPFIYNGAVAATNGHAILIIKDDALYRKHQSSAPDMTEKVDVILDNKFKTNNVLKISDFENAYNAWPQTPIYEVAKVQCGACCGMRTVTFEFDYKSETYETEDTCPVCEGYGSIEGVTDKETGKYELSDKYNIKVLNACFSPQFLNDILFLAKELKINEITSLIESRKLGVHMFQLTDCVLLVYMPSTSVSKPIAEIQ